jgi:hypothetical protein
LKLVEDPVNKAAKLNRVWTHTVGICAFFAAVVTIVGYFGIHPPQAKESKNEPPPKTEPKTSLTTPNDHPSKPEEQSSGLQPKPIGPGTFHLDGGFERGQPMLTKDALNPSDDVVTLTLTNSANNKEEKLTEVRVAYAIGANQAVGLWRKGARFVKGIQLNGAHVVRLGGQGFQSVEIPTDDSGRLQQNVVWPLANMFLQVEYAGPLRVNGGPELTSLIFGDADTGESGRTLPTRFSLDIPKTGEILGAVKGTVDYPRGSGEGRYLVVEADSSANEPPIKWSSEIDSTGKTNLRSSKGDLVRQGIATLKILHAKEAP